MEAISAGGAQTAPKISLAVPISETPRRPDEASNLNNRVNATQSVVESQASLTAPQTAPTSSARSGVESGLEQQLRQSAVQANSERAAAETSSEGNSRSAVSAFQSVSQLSSGNPTAVAESAGLTATPANTSTGNRLSIQA